MGSVFVDLAGGLVLVPALLGVVPLVVFVVLPYAAFERRHRKAWRKLAVRRAGFGGPYRRAAVNVAHGARAPALVRFAALTCFFLGAGTVPFATAAVAALVAGHGAGLALAAPAAVLLRLWIAGARLLEPDARALRSARAAARWLVHATFLLAAASIPLWLYLALVPGVPADGADLVAAAAAAALVGVAECVLLARATAAAARLLPEDDARAVQATPVVPAWMNKLLARKLVST